MSQLDHHLLLWRAHVSAGHLHSGLPQSCSRLALVTGYTLGEVETLFPDGSADLESIRPGDRSVCLEKTSHCPLWYCLSLSAWTHWCTACPGIYASMCSPPVSLIAQTLCQVREDMEQVLMVAPYWLNKIWFSGLMLMVSAPHWRIPLWRYFLSQGQGTIWHPHSDLWNLHVRSLERKKKKSEGFYPHW